jgi:hypothetical protein
MSCRGKTMSYHSRTRNAHSTKRGRSMTHSMSRGSIGNSIETRTRRRSIGALVRRREKRCWATKALTMGKRRRSWVGALQDTARPDRLHCPGRHSRPRRQTRRPKPVLGNSGQMSRTAWETGFLKWSSVVGHFEWNAPAELSIHRLRKHPTDLFSFTAFNFKAGLAGTRRPTIPPLPGKFAGAAFSLPRASSRRRQRPS